MTLRQLAATVKLTCTYLAAWVFRAEYWRYTVAGWVYGWHGLLECMMTTLMTTRMTGNGVSGRDASHSGRRKSSDLLRLSADRARGKSAGAGLAAW